MLFTCENVNVKIFTYGKKPNHLCACRGHIYTPHPIHIILLSFWRNKSNVISRAVFSFKRHAKQARYIYECVSFWLLREKFPGYKFHYTFFFFTCFCHVHVFVMCENVKIPWGEADFSRGSDVPCSEILIHGQKKKPIHVTSETHLVKMSSLEISAHVLRF